MSKYVVYNGIFLMQGSTAYELWHDTKDTQHMKKLQAHMKQLDQNQKDLLQRYDKTTKVDTYTNQGL